MKIFDGTRKALVIGISEYDNDISLDFCKYDGEEMSKLLSALGYEITENNKLIGYVPSEKMKDAIIDFFSDKDIKPKDTLLFYYSGHGIKSDQDGNVYLASSEIDPDLPIKRGFSFNDLRIMIENSISTRIVGILDCCYSGAAKISKGYEKDDAKIIVTIKEESKELEQGEGKCILAASRPYQGAYPKEELDHSIFTYYLLEGMKGNDESVDNNGYVTPYSLNKYVYKKINGLPLEKRPHQKPIMNLEASGDIVLAYYPQLARRTKLDDPSNLLSPTLLTPEGNERWRIESTLKNLVISREGVCDLITSLGYPLVPVKEQLLDSDKLFERKIYREEILEVNKLFSQYGNWIHPLTKEPFNREATIILVQIRNEAILRSRQPFEMTRYALKFGFHTSQAIFFFIAPNTRWLVIAAHTEMLGLPGPPQVRRLIIDLENITRTDLENVMQLKYPKVESEKVIDHFENALPYQKVGNKFFNEYHLLFGMFVNRLTSILEEESNVYTQRLLGKIAFLYFLQKKGWLNGDRAYIRHRLEGLSPKEAFMSLYDLFNMLNTEQSDTKSGDKIPFLNGSLFEKELRPISQLEKISEACGSIIPKVISIFEQYNFTISESTAFDKEVAVDPELLGSLFESMLPEMERGDKGTFYTHQNEMLFMARESIRLFLNNRLSNLVDHEQILYIVYNYEGPKSAISPNIARQLKEVLANIKILDPAVGSGGFLMAILQVLLGARNRINGIIGEIEQDYDMKLKIIENNLFGVDIENEAIELTRLRLWLTLVVDETLGNIRPLPNLDYNLHQGDSLKILESEKTLQSKITLDPTIEEALHGHMTAKREEYLHSHGKDKQIKRNELVSSIRKLLELKTGRPTPEILPFSYKTFFADVIFQGGFDVVIMNPPYITQEEIGRLQHQTDNYKAEIIEDIKLLTNNKFITNKQSDISVYFLVRSLTLLKPQGIAVVITPNKWLDARYGIELQEYFLTNAHLDCVYDSTDRSFSADVNTAITIIRKPSNQKVGAPNVENNLTRFVYFKIPYGQIDGSLIKDLWSIHTPGPEFRVGFRICTRFQSQLYVDGTTKNNDDSLVEESLSKSLGESIESLDKKIYVGTKWGNLYLHTPLVYHSILRKGLHKFRPLEDACHTIIRGPVTGKNAFFILKELSASDSLIKCRNGLGHEIYLEREYCPRILLKPDESLKYQINNEKLKLRIFSCRSDRSELKKTHALKYIEWAETSPDAYVTVNQGREKGKKKRIPEMTTLQGRSNWYQISKVVPASILAPQAIKNKQIVYFSKKPVYYADRFYGIFVEGDPINLWLYLNSSVFRLFLELNGRPEGGGVLSIKVYEYKQCPVLFPIPNISKKFKLLERFRSRIPYRIINIVEKGPLELEQDDRKQLDDLVLQEIGFTDSKEREKVLAEIYDWLAERIKERLSKPKTAPESLTKNIGKSKNKMNEDVLES